jgi:hypothetical protein
MATVEVFFNQSKGIHSDYIKQAMGIKGKV